MVLYSYRLSTTIGMQGPGNMVGYLLVSGAFLNWLRRPVGRFTVNEQRLEGEYRHVHSRVIVASEEVAFYNGNEREKWIIEQVFDGLIRHLRNAQRFRYSLGVVDTVVAKCTLAASQPGMLAWCGAALTLPVRTLPCRHCHCGRLLCRQPPLLGLRVPGGPPRQRPSRLD